MRASRESISRTQRDLQRLDGRRGPPGKRAVLWDDMDALMAEIATRSQASGGAFANALGATDVNPNFEAEILAALAADQAALEAVNVRVDNALTYADNLVNSARDDLGAAIDGANAAIDSANAALAGLNTRFDQAIPRIETAQQQADDLFLDLAWLAARLQDTDERIAGAGIYVDQESGLVRIAAIEQAEQRISAAEISVDALAGEISSRVSVAEMNAAISEALIDPSQIPILDDFEARVSTVEETLSAAEAAITERATVTTVSGIDVRLQSAESDIDALETEITLKASTTDLNGLETRVTSAEQTITGLDVAAITQTVFDTRSVSEDLDDLSMESLQALIDSYLNREVLHQEVALAKQEISADVTDTGAAIAAARLELGALIEGVTATISAEQVTRADEDSALAAQIASVEANFGDLGLLTEATVADELVAQADATSALTGQLQTLAASLGDVGLLSEATVTDELVAQADATGALTGQVQTLAASLGDVGLLSEATVAAELVAQAGADTALGGRIDTVESDLNGVQSSVTTQATAISTLESYASATYTIRLNAGGASAGLEIVAADDPVNGPVSAFRFHADAIIFDGTIYGQHIAADSINATHINVSSLSAISATLGTFQSAPSGERLVIEGDRLTVYDANNVVRVRLGRLS